MTRLEIVAKAFCAVTGCPESDALAWAKKNAPASVAADLNRQVPDEESERLLAELRDNPSAVLTSLIQGFFVKTHGGGPAR